MEQQMLLHREESQSSPGRSKAVTRRWGGSRHISHWDAEDLVAWEAGNKRIARRNLLWSVVTVHLGYSVWTLWPVLVLFMPENVYGFSAGDKFLLDMVATLVGAGLRIPYSVATTVFGGRNWATFSAAVLLLPVVGTMVLLLHPGLPLWPYLVCAALSGLGGGNFAASMSNANAFYPHRLKGSALGIAGGIGNLGVPAIQLMGLLIIAVAGEGKPYLICALYSVFLAIAAVGVALSMNNVAQHRVKARHMRPIVTTVLANRDTYLLSLLYLGTFGSFIGFSFAFGQVLQTNFMAIGEHAAQATLHAAELAFLGPLLAAVARIYGGRLADRLGGSRITLMVFVAMTVVAGLLISASSLEGRHSGPMRGATMTGYFVCFIALFVLAGLGNGSVYKMIPTIFAACGRSLDHGPSVGGLDHRDRPRVISGVVIGFVSALGALGGVGINLALRESFVATGTTTDAFWLFMVFYAGAAALTWKVYVRRPVVGIQALPPAIAPQPAPAAAELLGS
ncbi:Nitrate/nitrite transporter NarK [Mycobacterium marinum]|uniref:nitrate/nitrite transporter n=1 Tax=Mycobacterium marinum TaxID=1781 RepID=UPI000358B092|nr:nitrate/nitrite transporter [Mycobacterium marinum]AXN45639.1 Nitrate/nitrite transporter NarK [Mycobacterium marinum]AXN50905.1 Nitrate/nitrite transporter NarK [Mycobacterium marinum]EPQ74962.1 Nitrate/nitrite transporter [Mycobacterium marinum str. Europe]RFZ01809.1 Nitrate/nitrite transporter NarK [Mycobacterium marinum]RFZ06907.1 Nitrate/nitrite transporter NarK [Mycobacterium marinum]